MTNLMSDWRDWKLDQDCSCFRCKPFNNYNKLRLVNNEEGRNKMEQITETVTEAKLTDEQLEAILAQTFVTADEAEETDEQKVLN